MRLAVLARQLRNSFDRQVASHNITRSQWSLVSVVARHPGSTQRWIAEALDMSEASAGRLIDRLCAEGLLERRARKDDRRARAVYLTEAANPLLETIGEVAGIFESRMFKNFSDDELEQLGEFFDRIYDNVSRG